jgi:prepilin-type N-terminal cleavage/methylation domain-containing protein
MCNNEFMKKNLGFTLLELLVVISIIGLLVAMGAVAFTTAQQRGRDSRRRGDMQAIQKAFEQYYAENTGYSSTCSTMADAHMPGGLPDDPQTSEAYSIGCSATEYCVCASLEDTGAGNADAPTRSTCNYNSAGTYYCVSNLQ